jgi:hypothetical protein
MSIRIKSHWFRDATPKSAAQNASAMAFIVWRVAQNMLKQMRVAQFDIDAGAPYFGFMREVLVFLLQVADRIAFERMDAAARTEFTTAMVRRVAEILQENEDHLLGPAPAGEAPWGMRFIDQFNELSTHYSEFGGEPHAADFTPDFGFVRYLGSRLEPDLPPKDRRWVIDQVMAAEVPDALAMVQSSMRDLFSTEPRKARRSSMSGE